MAVSAKAKASALEREAKRVLASVGLDPAVRPRKKRTNAGVEYWRVENTQGLSIARRCSLPGQWYVNLWWEVFDDPGKKSGHIVQASSISLNVRDHRLTDAIGTNCLVRYDIDKSRSRTKAHLNVLQPPSLEDRIHYPVVGLETNSWPLRPVLDFFLSEGLQKELEPLLP